MLAEYGLQANQFSVRKINTGHINYTFNVSPGYVLQRINRKIFLEPQILADNLRIASAYLKASTPDYLFLNPIQSLKGKELVYDQHGFPWRLFPYIPNSVTLNEVADAAQAREAATAFGRLSKHLSGCDVTLFKEVIPQFHDLSARFELFKQSLNNSQAETKEAAMDVISGYLRFEYLVDDYQQLIDSGKLKLRVMHNDTKINNVLFDKQTYEALCVIDLDTLMPGYFIYDLGDMIRTFVCPVSEEEKDYSKIVVRKEILDAVMEGYLAEMSEVLTGDELTATPLAGPTMTFMIGLRFLTDYLNGDIYFSTSYPRQNLIRATNQLNLLEKLVDISV